MSVQAAPALVAGAVPQPAPPNSATTMPIQLTSAYTVQRPFFLAGQRVEVGAVVDLPLALAIDLKGAGKVAPVAAVDAQVADQTANPQPNKRTPRRPASGTAA